MVAIRDTTEPRVSRVLKIVGIVAAALVLIVAGVLAAGGAGDQPGLHTMGNHEGGPGQMDHAGNHTRPSSGHHGLAETDAARPGFCPVELCFTNNVS